MGEKFRRFMTGRYGQDELGKFTLIVSFAVLIVSMFTAFWVALVAVGLLVWQYYRMFSRNTGKRMQENYAYLRVKNKVTGWFKERRNRLKQRKTHRFYKCPSCAQALRVPKHLGKITITCPKCSNKIMRTT